MLIFYHHEDEFFPRISKVTGLTLVSSSTGLLIGTAGRRPTGYWASSGCCRDDCGGGGQHCSQGALRWRPPGLPGGDRDGEAPDFRDFGEIRVGAARDRSQAAI